MDLVEAVETVVPGLPPRSAVANPERKPRVADMHVAMRHDDRLSAVALGPAPVHRESFALVYCHDDLRGGETLAFDRVRRAVR